MKMLKSVWIAPLVLVTALVISGTATAKKYAFEREVEFSVDYKTVASCVFDNQEALEELNASAAIEAPPTAAPMNVTKMTGDVRGRYLDIMLHRTDEGGTRMEYRGTKKLDNETMFSDIVACVDRIAAR